MASQRKAEDQLLKIDAAEEEFGSRVLSRRIKDQYSGLHRIAGAELAMAGKAPAPGELSEVSAYGCCVETRASWLRPGRFVAIALPSAAPSDLAIPSQLKVKVHCPSSSAALAKRLPRLRRRSSSKSKPLVPFQKPSITRL